MALPLSSLLEALLFAAGEPIARKRLPTLLDTSSENVEDALNALRITLDDRGLALIETETEVELRTAPEASGVIAKLREAELSRDLGKASLETLAIILYKEKATRTEIDWIRGVNSGTALRALLLRGLIERIDNPEDRRRARYAPTIDALAHLGVARKEDLPRFIEFKNALTAEKEKQEEAEANKDHDSI